MLLRLTLVTCCRRIANEVSPAVTPLILRLQYGKVELSPRLPDLRVRMFRRIGGISRLGVGGEAARR